MPPIIKRQQNDYPSLSTASITPVPYKTHNFTYNEVSEHEDEGGIGDNGNWLSSSSSSHPLCHSLSHDSSNPHSRHHRHSTSLSSSLTSSSSSSSPSRSSSHTSSLSSPAVSIRSLWIRNGQSITKEGKEQHESQQSHHNFSLPHKTMSQIVPSLHINNNNNNTFQKNKHTQNYSPSLSLKSKEDSAPSPYHKNLKKKKNRIKVSQKKNNNTSSYNDDTPVIYQHIQLDGSQPILVSPTNNIHVKKGLTQETVESITRNPINKKTLNNDENTTKRRNNNNSSHHQYQMRSTKGHIIQHSGYSYNHYQLIEPSSIQRYHDDDDDDDAFSTSKNCLHKSCSMSQCNNNVVKRQYSNSKNARNNKNTRHFIHNTFELKNNDVDINGSPKFCKSPHQLLLKNVNSNHDISCCEAALHYTQLNNTILPQAPQFPDHSDNLKRNTKKDVSFAALAHNGVHRRLHQKIDDNRIIYSFKKSNSDQNKTTTKGITKHDDVKISYNKSHCNTDQQQHSTINKYLITESSLQLSISLLSQQYTYEELLVATDGFNSKRKLGKGACGAVYSGTLPSGTEVAVKVLKSCEENGFEEEIRVLSRCRHPNLVTLMGWGEYTSRRFIVYEFLPGGDLCHRLERSSSHTSKKKSLQKFHWKQRLRIALEICQGVSFLHSCRPKVFHRDIKAANVLLTEHGTAKLADFGLACVANASALSSCVERPEGTPGYADPQYIRTLEVNEPREVYSLGMLFLELLSARPPAVYIRNSCGEEVLKYLLDDITIGSVESVLALIDTSSDIPQPIAIQWIELCFRCIAENETSRPKSSEVVRELKALLELTLCRNNNNVQDLSIPSKNTCKSYNVPTIGTKQQKNDVSHHSIDSLIEKQQYKSFSKNLNNDVNYENVENTIPSSFEALDKINNEYGLSGASSASQHHSRELKKKNRRKTLLKPQLPLNTKEAENLVPPPPSPHSSSVKRKIAKYKPNDNKDTYCQKPLHHKVALLFDKDEENNYNSSLCLKKNNDDVINTNIQKVISDQPKQVEKQHHYQNSQTSSNYCHQNKKILLNKNQDHNGKPPLLEVKDFKEYLFVFQMVDGSTPFAPVPPSSSSGAYNIESMEGMKQTTLTTGPDTLLPGCTLAEVYEALQHHIPSVALHISHCISKRYKSNEFKKKNKQHIKSPSLSSSSSIVSSSSLQSSSSSSLYQLHEKDRQPLRSAINSNPSHTKSRTMLEFEGHPIPFGRKRPSFRRYLKPNISEDLFSCVSRQHFSITPKLLVICPSKQSSIKTLDASFEVKFVFRCLTPNGAGVKSQSYPLGLPVPLDSGDIVHLFSSPHTPPDDSYPHRNTSTENEETCVAKDTTNNKNLISSSAALLQFIMNEDQLRIFKQHITNTCLHEVQLAIQALIKPTNKETE